MEKDQIIATLQQEAVCAKQYAQEAVAKKEQLNEKVQKIWIELEFYKINLNLLVMRDSLKVKIEESSFTKHFNNLHLVFLTNLPQATTLTLTKKMHNLRNRSPI